jgi:hypothetical protein
VQTVAIGCHQFSQDEKEQRRKLLPAPESSALVIERFERAKRLNGWNGLNPAMLLRRDPASMQ